MFEQSLLSFAFQDALKKVSSVDNYLLDGFNRSVINTIDGWLREHPFFHWLVNHPLISAIAFLIAAILIIRLLVTIYRAISSTIDRMWLWILQSPFLLLKLVFGWERKPKNSPENTLINNYQVTSNPEQLQEILRRLDLIQQQQAQILLDIAELKQESVAIAPIDNSSQLKLAGKMQQNRE